MFYILWKLYVKGGLKKKTELKTVHVLIFTIMRVLLRVAV